MGQTPHTPALAQRGAYRATGVNNGHRKPPSAVSMPGSGGSGNTSAVSAPQGRGQAICSSGSAPRPSLANGGRGEENPGRNTLTNGGLTEVPLASPAAGPVGR